LHEELPRLGEENILDLVSQDNLEAFDRLCRRILQKVIVCSLIHFARLGEDRPHEIVPPRKIVLKVRKVHARAFRDGTHRELCIALPPQKFPGGSQDPAGGGFSAPAHCGSGADVWQAPAVVCHAHIPKKSAHHRSLDNIGRPTNNRPPRVPSRKRDSALRVR
jgi:hypothetical protein